MADKKTIFARALCADLARTGSLGLNEKARNATLLHVLDTIIAAVAGARAGGIGRVAGAVDCIGEPSLLSPSRRAFAIALAAHALQADDGDADAGTHPGAVVVAAAWAARAAQASGRDFLIAVYLGYRAAALIARALPVSAMKGGWHRTPLICGFGAAASAAWMSGIRSEDGLRNTLNIAASLVGGILPSYQPVGSMEALHPAFAAEAGLRAAALANAGVVASDQALDGANGLLAAVSLSGRQFPDHPGAGIETAYVKRYPCVRAAHEAIDAMLHFAPPDPRIELHLSPSAMRFSGAFPGFRVDAALNIAYCLAVVILKGNKAPTPSDFDAAMRQKVQASGIFERIITRHSDTPESTMKIVDASGTRTVDLQKRRLSEIAEIEMKWDDLLAHGDAPELKLWGIEDCRSSAECLILVEQHLECSLAAIPSARTS